MAMRVAGRRALQIFAELIADEGLVRHRSIERVEEEDIDGAVGGSGGEVGEDARRHLWHRATAGGFGGGESRVLLEVSDPLWLVAFE